jgi:hypothetical protein
VAYFTVAVAPSNSWYGFRALEGLIKPMGASGFEAEALLQSLAVWILIAGRLLYKSINVQAEDLTSDESNPAGNFSLQHWKICREKFQNVSMDEKVGLNDATREMVRDAAREMELIESQ